MNKFDPHINTPLGSLNESEHPPLGVTESPTGYVIPALLKNQRVGSLGQSAGRSAGKVRPMVLLWALGVPLPIVLIFFLVRGCS